MRECREEGDVDGTNGNEDGDRNGMRRDRDGDGDRDGQWDREQEQEGDGNELLTILCTIYPYAIS
jgi:hypothetical protein